ncbi:MAG: PAS domain-containing protein [Pirellulaceae bacterium]|nr:PAS domain-containing protein [Pirellulaceae bacterium]
MIEFEALFDRHPTPTWVHSAQSDRFLAVNQATLRSLGYTRDELLAKRFVDIVSSDDFARVETCLRSQGAAGGSVCRLICQDESYLAVELNSQAISFRCEPAFMVTLRHLGHGDEVIERLNFALTAGKVSVWEYTIADRSLHWDPNRTGVYGIDRSLFPKSHDEFLELVELEHREPLQKAFEACVSHGATYDCQFEMQLPGVGRRWRHAIGRRTLDVSGKPYKIIGVGIDITERKMFEEQVQRAQKFEAVGRLANGIAHDFNNILTVIKGYSQLLTAAGDLQLAHQASQEITKASTRAAGLVQQLLNFSKSQPVDPRPVEVNQLVTQTLALLQRLLPANIRLALEIDTEVIYVYADPGQIEQLVMNLCLNARDAMPQGGDLTVRTQRHAPDFCITISDTGHGMSTDVQQRMFEPFFTTKEVGKGSGLGLSIVQGIVKQLGGSIRVVSATDQGTSFCIHLPVIPNDSDSE